MSSPSNPYAAYGGIVDSKHGSARDSDPYAAYDGKVAAESNSSPAAPSFIDRLTEIQKPDPNHPWSYKEALKAVGNIGAGGLGMILHPIDTLAGAGGMLTFPIELAMGHPWSSTVPAQMLHGLHTNPYGTIEAGIGQAGLAETLPHVLEPVADAARDVTEGGVRRLAGSGPGVAAKLAHKATENNRVIDLHNADKMATARQAWLDAQQKARASYKADLLALRQKYMLEDAPETSGGSGRRQAEYESARVKAIKANADARAEYNRQIGEIAQQNREVTASERVKAQQAAHQQVAGSQLIYGLNQLDKVLRAKAGVMFDNVRDLIADAKQPPLPGTKLGAAARAALSKVTGSSELPKPFRDILAKYPESDPEFIEYQGAQIPKTNRLYDVLKQQGMGASAPPVTFGDLQGYYTETGAELSKGTLPGDVYLATKELHNALGGMMQEMAKAAGPEANAAFWDSRVFYRNYMDVFHEPSGPSGSGSPVAQTLLAKDPATAVDKFSGDAGDRGIATLRRYSDSLANLAQEARQTAQAKVEVPRGGRQTMVGKPEPKITPVPTGADLSLPPIIPDEPVVPYRAPKLAPRKVISEADLQRANEAAVRARAAGLAGHLFWWTGVWPAFRMLSELSRGAEVSLKSTALMPAAGAAGMATEELMAQPAVMQFLTRATRQQVARIPPDLRGEIPEIITLAKQHGVHVSPILTAYAATIQRNRAGQQGSQQ